MMVKADKDMITLLAGGKNMRDEEEIRKELRKRERIFHRMKNDPSYPPASYAMIEGYISALRWVLEEIK